MSRQNRSGLLGAILLVLGVLAAPPLAQAAFQFPVYVTAGSNDAGNPPAIPSYPYYIARSDELGNYMPSGSNLGAYYATTAHSPIGLTVGSDHNLYVATRTFGDIQKVSTATATTSTFIAGGTGGLSTPLYLTFGPTGDLYVSSDGNRRIYRYDPAGVSKPSGANPGAIFSDVVTTAPGLQPVGLDVSHDGTKLFAAYQGSNPADGFLGVHDSNTGALLQSIGIGKNAWDVVALNRWEVLVSTLANDIVKINVSTSTVSTFIPAGQGGMSTPRGMEIGPDGLLYVADRSGLRVLRFDPVTGANMPAPTRTGAFHTQNYSYPGGFDFIWDVVLPEPMGMTWLACGIALAATRRRR